VPSQVADDAEWAALIAVIARHPGATLQVIVDNFMRMTGPDSVERIGKLAKAAGIRMQWAGVPALKFQAKVLPRLEALHEQFKAEGLDFWTGYHHVSPTSVINFISTLVFGQNGNPVWQEVINEKDEAKKLAMLADEAWRDRARDAWDNLQYRHSYLNDPSAMTLRESETGYGPLGVTLADYMAQTGINHASDAMAEWVLTNGVHSVIYKKSWELDEDVVLRLLRDPRSVGNLSDSGAHGKLFCGGGDNVLLLTDFGRDRQLLSIEEAVHVMTGKLADHFGLHDRGVLKEGMQADIAVFNLDEIERRPEEKIWDVPDGEGGRTYRYSRAAAPMRLTLCNGVATFDNGAVTGTFPGRYIGPTAPEPQALAAE
jgi:N-acyl-D-amino-acid deacylase